MAKTQATATRSAKKPAPKIGRPRVLKEGGVLAVSIDETMRKRLRKAAKAADKSVSALTREFIERGLTTPA